MKLKILKKKPGKIIAKIIDTGQEVNYAPKFLEKRIEMGVFDVVNPEIIRKKI